MIIVRILGGLGNQMFQYAFAKALEKKGFEVKLDVSSFKKYKLHGGYQLDKYTINIKNAKNTSIFFSKINPLKTVKEKGLLFDNKLFSLKGNEYVKGYFQTEKYFSEIRNILLEQFIVQKKIASSTKIYQKEISKTKNSCSIHIRRGDYVSDKKANTVHGTCSIKYYKEAIKLIKKENKEIQFFIFSDDISWTKENLPFVNAVYIDHQTIPHEDMYLMSLCNHNITANSSFSWWGAWLNKNIDKTVIAPKQWFVDKENEIACKNWIQL